MRSTELHHPKIMITYTGEVKHSFEVFIKQLEANLSKKHNGFYKIKAEEFLIFEQFLFKKEICNHIIIDGKEQKVFGSVWEFIFRFE